MSEEARKKARDGGFTEFDYSGIGANIRVTCSISHSICTRSTGLAMGAYYMLSLSSIDLKFFSVKIRSQILLNDFTVANRSDIVIKLLSRYAPSASVRDF